MAQDFQDLTGQVIKKIVSLAQALENGVMTVLIDVVPDARRTEEVENLMNGPVVNVEGRELKLGTLGAGDFFGELSLLTGEPSSFTVRAVATVETYRINQAMFQELVMQRESLVEPLYRVLSDRQQEQRTLLEREAEAMKQPPQQLDLLDKLMKLIGGR